jgi:hypothetical protein
VTETLTRQQILSLPLDGPGFLTSKTVGQYLMSTFRLFIREQDSFNAKRPFGSSDWEDPLIFAFAKADLIWLRMDENGLIDDYPYDLFWGIVNDLADFLYELDFSAAERILPPPPPKEWYLVCVDREGITTGHLTDYLGEPMTEDHAKEQAETHNEPYGYRAWVPVHIPAVS